MHTLARILLQNVLLSNDYLNHFWAINEFFKYMYESTKSISLILNRLPEQLLESTRT